MNRFAAMLCVLGFCLTADVEAFAAMTTPVINEFLAENAGGLRDQDGDTPDWIEIYNPSSNAVNLAGWHLTETPTNLMRWTFPATNLPPYGYLVVFASLKDRAVAGAELHTNFRLDPGGEYLALVQPDGVTVATEFSPAYLPQRANVSYGFATLATTPLKIDFNDDDSGESASTNTQAGFTSMTLSSNPLTIGPVTVTIASIGSTTLDDRDRSLPAPSTSMTQAELYDDFIYSTSQTDGTGLSVHLSGLNPGGTYQLRIWCNDPGAGTTGERTSSWVETAGGSVVPITTFSWSVSRPVANDYDSSFTATVVASETGELHIEGTRAGGTGTSVYVNALELNLISAERQLKYFPASTPGAANGNGFLGLVSDTKFSVDRGYYYSPFQVAITNATAGALIYFTTNGTAPSPGKGQLYLGPISVSSNTLLRAAAFKADWVPSDVDTHTYLFPDQVVRQSEIQPGYPTTWQASYPADYGMDPNVVNHPVYGASLSNDLRSLPVISIVASHDDLWHTNTGIYNHATSIGPQWERPASVELFKPGGGTEFAVNCGLEMQGNASRDNVRTPKHSFRLVFKSDYGPTRLRYEWFPGTGSVQEFNTIVLRALGFVDGWATRYSDTTPIANTTLIGTRYRPENATYLKDAWMKQTFSEMGNLATRSTYAHLFLNGLYWGIYNPSERIDAPFAASHLGGREEDWDVIAGDEAYNVIEVRDGNRLDWDAMMTYVETAAPGTASYQNIAAMIDLENLADYMILHIFAESEDWPTHNWYALHRRSTNGLPATRWTFTPWDQEILLDRYVRRDRTGVNNTNTPARIYSKMRNYPEFRQLFGDRVQKHVVSGALSASNNIARFEALGLQIHDALVAESARWGDAREFTIGANPGTGVTFTRDEWWVPEMNALYGFLQTLNDYWIPRFRSNLLYPMVGPPQFSQAGGPVPAGYEVTLSHTNTSGAIYYTTDGTDPRAMFTSAVSQTANVYDAPIPLNTSTLVRARVLSGGTWSAVVEAPFYPPQNLDGLCLTEVMYNPLPSGLTNSDAFEFLELRNSGATALNLSGLTFSQGIAFTFTNGTWLAPGEYAVLGRDAAALQMRYPGIQILGLYSGKLDNTGETITLSHPSGATVLSLTYGDATPWPTAADGFGFSIVPKQPGVAQASDKGTAWRASAQPGGSPGREDPEPNWPQVVVNEILAHTDPPMCDAVELRNIGSTRADVSGWYLTDDRQTPRKFKIPEGTFIEPGACIAFDATQFNSVPGSPTNFLLSSTGDEVYLFSADAGWNLTGYSYGVEFGASWNGASFGRWVNEIGEEFFPLQIHRSLGLNNPGPQKSPVVINEIHYHPLADEPEFIELLNLTPNPVALFDALHPTNTWHLSGVNFNLPEGTYIPGNGLLIITGTNAAAFRARYSVPEGVQVFGPFTGQLQNSGEWLRLQAADNPNIDAVPYVTVEDVRYNDRAPWPPEADGSGLSLQRRNSGYGNSPSVWAAAIPTPGRLFAEADTDNDALPDWWELENGTQPYITDASEDPDGDGLSNYQEYMAGTSPFSYASALRVSLENGSIIFEAMSARTYLLQKKATLEAAEWTTVSTIGAAETNRVLQIPVNQSNEAGFFRLLIPAQQ